MPTFIGKCLMAARRFGCQSLYGAGLLRVWANLSFDSPCYIVLCYHGVSEKPHSLFTSVKLFDEHLAMMRRWGNVTALDEVGSFLASGKAPPGPKFRFIITFDDGYANVVRNAAPVLRKYRAKATVYINPGWIATRCEPWWFRLNGSDPIRQALKSFLGDQDFRDPMDRNGGDHLPEWLVNRILRKVAPEELEQWWQKFCESLPEPPPACCIEAALADWGDLESAADVLDVGSHTSSHSILGTCRDLAFGRDAVLNSKQQIEKALGKPCLHFAYPRGAIGDYNQVTRSWLLEAGHQTAVTTQPGAVQMGTDPLEIPRFYVTETPTGELEADIVGMLRLWDRSVELLRNRLKR